MAAGAGFYASLQGLYMREAGVERAGRIRQPENFVMQWRLVARWRDE